MLYFKPQYIDNYKLTFPLADFGRNDVQFVQLFYWVDRNYLSLKTSGWTYPSMERIVAHNGLEVMRKWADFPYSTYRLLREQVEPVDGMQGVVQVTETYGYTPSVTINEPAMIAWQRPGFENTSTGGTQRTITLNEFDEGTQEHILTVDNSDGLFVSGNLVTFEVPATGSFRKRISKAPVRISSATTTTIRVPYFTLLFIYSSGGIAGEGPSNEDSDMFTNNSRTRYVTTYASKRSVYSADFSGYKETAFVTKNPQDFVNSAEPFQILLGGEVTDTLTTATVPTVSNYLSNLAAGNFLIPQPQQIEQLMGDVFTRTTFYLPYQ